MLSAFIIFNVNHSFILFYLKVLAQRVIEQKITELLNSCFIILKAKIIMHHCSQQNLLMIIKL
jgi:hypothetical protein